MVKAIKERLEEIRQLCQSHNVEELYLIGSAAKGALKPDSDMDFLVRFKPFNGSQYFDNYRDLKHQLARILDKDVDLVEAQTLNNPVLKKNINRNKELIYG